MSGYLNQPQQPGPYRVENTFQKGLQLDTPPDNTSNLVMTGGLNMHLLRQQGSEIILATEPGMERSCLLPPNHVVHGWAERGGVLYLLLAEVNDSGEATGRGQLGTFPTPDYQYLNGDVTRLVEEGEMRWLYRGLHVYFGDANQNNLQPLESREFNLSLDAPSELELQDSYDGTLNIIINDRGRNPALLVNSGFVALPPNANSPAGSPGRYKIIERAGDAQTNRYRRADFKSRLQLLPKGGSLAKAYLLEVASGGKLAAGSYRYYFTYCDADGNETGIFAECGPVEVFEAPTPAEARGGRPGETTTLSVKLRLENLDKTFGFVRLRYARRGGEPEAASVAYELEQKFSIGPTGACELTHTGYEPELGVSAAQLQLAAGSLSTFVTMCQGGGRLLLGGVRQDAVDDRALLDFAASIRLGHEQVALREVPGLDTGDGPGRGLYQPLNRTGTDPMPGDKTPYTHPRGSWLGGYLNPLNTCYRLGYMAGESYPFGVRFILDDYSVTETYPLRGSDNIDNFRNEGSYADDSAPGYYDELGWHTQGTGYLENRTGVYRFPSLRSPGTRSLVQTNENAVNILAARVLLPPIPDELRRRTVGVQFMRAPRRPNTLAQGYLLPTLRSLRVAPEGGKKPYDHHHGDVKTVLEGNTGNLKVLPTVGGVLEACDLDYGNKFKREKVGVFPFAFNRRSNYPGSAATQALPLTDPRRMALYSPEALLRPAQLLARLNERRVQVQPLGVAFTKTAVRFDNNLAGGVPGGSWSVYKTVSHQPALSSQPTRAEAKSYWTLDNQAAVNGGFFGSQEKYLLGKDASDEKYLLNLAWDPYVGVEFADTDLDQSRTLTSGTGKNTGVALQTQIGPVLADPPQPAAYLVNIYDQGGPLGRDGLRVLYAPESLSYVPITQRLSWRELEEQLDGDGKLLLYGGDTYVGVSYRRVFRALAREQRLEEKFDAPVGQLLSLVCETSVNPYCRSEEAPAGGVATTPSFSPLLGASKGRIQDFRETGYVSQAESSRVNAGYSSESEASPVLVGTPARPRDVPYRAQEFGARVWASALSVDGSFNNGYRFLPPLSFRDYERQLGKIMRLLPVGENQVLVVHEHGLELLGLNDQTLTGQNTGGPVYAEARTFLPEKGRIISRELGSQHPFAVCVSPKGVYGVDATQRCVWFWAFGAGEAVRLSDFSISAQVGPLLQSYQGRPTRLLSLDIRAVYDPSRADVVFSLYQKTS